jgi:hypothetical protein
LSSTFGSSPLVRQLAPWAPAGTPAPGPQLAERLGEWVTAFDAIGLQAAHRAIKALPPHASAPRGRAAGATLAADFERTRGTLARAIAQDAALPHESGYAPYKRRHFELQRQMEQLVGALREHVREVLSRGRPALRQLAALDAALEKVLARREQSLLPTAVALLERRFEQCRQAAGPDEDAAAWRAAFEAEWRAALRAELDLRLQPVAGLVEAAGIELNSEP